MAFTVSSQDGQRDVLGSYTTNINGDQTLTIEMPNDGIIRDILTVSLYIGDIATLLTNPENFGPSINHTRGTNSRLYIGEARWIQIKTDTLVALVVLRHRVTVWPTDELRFSFREVDTNVTPTADLTVALNTLRIRETS